MSTRITCDGCGKPVGTHNEPNYWQCTLMGDLVMGSSGLILESTGLQDKSRQHIRNADMCNVCIAKTQEGDNE